MKRFSALIVLFVYAFISLSGCVQKGTNNSSKETIDSISVQESTSSDSITNDNNSASQIEEVLSVIDFGYSNKKSSSKYEQVWFKIQNNTQETLHTITLSVVFLDEEKNIVHSTYPQTSNRLFEGQTTTVDVSFNKEEVFPYYVYIDKFSYYNEKDECFSFYTNSPKIFDLNNNSNEDKTRDSVIEDGYFNFTPGSFYQRFENTLPDGFGLKKDLVNNPFLEDRLQYGICFEDGENTGVVIIFNTSEKTDKIKDITLQSSVNEYVEVEDFRILLDWFIRILLTDLDDEKRESYVEDFTKIFQADEHKLAGKYGNEYTLTLSRGGNGIFGESYYITIKLL